jgi:hypothetical protein
MEKVQRKTARATARRAPYRRPTLRSYGSLQSLTRSQNILSKTFDGAGGGGKTRV